MWSPTFENIPGHYGKKSDHFASKMLRKMHKPAALCGSAAGGRCAWRRRRGLLLLPTSFSQTQHRSFLGGIELASYKHRS